MAQPLKEILNFLLEKILDEVSINTEINFFHNNEAGSFSLNRNAYGIDPVISIKWPKPSLRLSAKNSKLESSSQLSEIIGSWDKTLNPILVLAHEYGHYLSYKNGTRTLEYERALSNWELNNPLSKKQKTLILNEENIAWSNAFSVLRSLGSKKSKLFRKTKKRALLIYRKKLKSGLYS